MANEIEAMLTSIKKKTEDWWKTNKSPYLVSNISPDLKSQGMNWRDIVGPNTGLAKFLHDKSIGNFQVISHPSHRAKVGLIPVGENYEFSPEHNAESSTPIPKDTNRTSSNARFVVLNFLNALSELGDEDLDKVQIPISVLVKLIARR